MFVGGLRQKATPLKLIRKPKYQYCLPIIMKWLAIIPTLLIAGSLGDKPATIECPPYQPTPTTAWQHIVININSHPDDYPIINATLQGAYGHLLDSWTIVHNDTIMYTNDTQVVLNVTIIHDSNTLQTGRLVAVGFACNRAAFIAGLDLWVVVHEVGHLLGLEHEDHSWMSESWLTYYYWTIEQAEYLDSMQNIK